MNRGKGGSSFVGDPACITVMRWKKYKDGAITYHVPVNIRLLASEVEWPEAIAPKKKTNACVNREDVTVVPRSRDRQGTLSYASTRRVQGKLANGIQEAQELIWPLLERQTELEMFLNRYDEDKMMKRELTRKWLHEDVLGPLQSKLDRHMAVCNPLEVKMRQKLYQRYLQHGNIKGDVFLDDCDLEVYNPYLLRDKKPHRCKRRTTELKKLFHERPKRKNTARCLAGCQYKWTRQSEVQDGGDVTPVIDPFYVEPAEESHAQYSRTCLDVPYFLRKYATRDGTCHHEGCGFS
ncbi:uncharacterized protein LOC130907413 [Corythoichthys intestinalis]|uniref:uncharacterized protein LOC130907413 n=1 Tax=Corythoichthys intestinalis TaxID=161448 RepID=UPI0025A5097E|nr:uncharacterized protein LOC130907413 [Corythoichthys intestinalis]